jgi:hypothetical protein
MQLAAVQMDCETKSSWRYTVTVGTFTAVVSHCSEDSASGPCLEPDEAYHLHTLPSFSPFIIIVHCPSSSSLPFLYLAFSWWNSEKVVIFPMRATLPASLNLSIMRYSPQHPVTTLICCYLWMGKFYTNTGTRLDPWLQTSAAKYMRTALFWAITQRVVVIPYRSFGTTYHYR